MTPSWSPHPEFVSSANLAHYMRWLAERRNLTFRSYHELWTWSVEHLDDFWSSLFGYFAILHDGTWSHVHEGKMPHTRWFDGVRLSYAEHIFRQENPERPAILYQNESQSIKSVSWSELKEMTVHVQHFLRTAGVEMSDRVVAYMPNIPETTACFLAANATGAVWSSCSPDFGTASILDRFQQIEPAALIAVDGYQYNGKFFDTRSTVEQLIRSLPSLRVVLVVGNPYKHLPKIEDARVTYWDALEPAGTELTFARVPFQHPQWVLFSSGTTGLPKAITHSVGGILLEQLKYGTFHNNFKPGDRCFWFTTTGWMMWNYIHGSLLAGGTLVLYDGSPAYPTLGALWQLCEQARITHFGTSASFIMACKKADLHPAKAFDFSALQSIGSTGSPLPPEGFDWVYSKVKKDVWLTSMSGGTDVCSAFVGGNPLLPVYEGEIQCRALGCSLEAWNDAGQPLHDEVGEMVITKPMPSMPVFFWNDKNHQRYTESYFEHYPGVWRHGDWIRITPRDGIIIYGRSDATLNRGGVRIGTSEIYRAMDTIAEVQDSLIVCIEEEGGNFWMPLFVILKPDAKLDETLTKRINKTIRDACSPRHVPDEIIETPDVPYTISGKKTETPVKKILMGLDPARVVNPGTLRNPDSIDFFIQLRKERAR